MAEECQLTKFRVHCIHQLACSLSGRGSQAAGHASVHYASYHTDHQANKSKSIRVAQAVKDARHLKVQHWYCQACKLPCLTTPLCMLQALSDDALLDVMSTLVATIHTSLVPSVADLEDALLSKHS
jgi:hypothetical protein